MGSEKEHNWQTREGVSWKREAFVLTFTVNHDDCGRARMTNGQRGKRSME